MSLYTVGWIVWIVYFLALEIPAVVNSRNNDTLSEQLWWILGIGKRRVTGWAYVRRIGFLLFAAWLVIHTFSGGWV